MTIGPEKYLYCLSLTSTFKKIYVYTDYLPWQLSVITMIVDSETNLWLHVKAVFKKSMITLTICHEKG